MDKNEMGLSIEKLFKNSLETKKQFEKVDAEINSLKNNMNSRATIKELN